MTKTPPLIVDDDLNTLGVLKRRGVGGGEEQLFYIDSWQPSPQPHGPFHRNTNYSGVTDYIPSDINTRIRMCECFIYECYKPLKNGYTQVFLFSTVKHS